MCLGKSKALKKAEAAQAEATAKLAAAEKAKTTNMVAETAGVVQTNPKTSSKKPMYSLRIPVKNPSNLGGMDNTYGLNIPL